MVTQVKLLLSLITGYTFALPLCAQDHVVGHVTTFSGFWKDRRCDCTIDQGYRVTDTSDIARSSPPLSSDVLKIRLAADASEMVYDCSKRDCGKRLDLPPVPPTASKISALVHAALSVASGSASPNSVSIYGSTLSRGNASILLDAIAPVDNPTVLLTSILGGAPKGTYLLDWCPVSSNGVPTCVSIPAPDEITWQPPQSAKGTVRPLKPGLYKVYECEKQDDLLLRGDSAFVLIAIDEAKSNQLRSLNSELASYMNDWSPKEQSMIGHAYMQYLNRSVNR
jgi:hypothetical protein